MAGLENTNHVVFYGADDFQLERALKRLRAEVVDPNFGALGHKVLQNPGLPDINEALASMSFALGGRTLIEFHQPTCLFNAVKDNAQQTMLDEIKSLIENPASQTLFVWVSSKLDARIGFPKWLLAQKSLVQATKFEPYKFWQLDDVKRFLWNEAQRDGIQIEDNAISELVDSWGADLRLLSNEMEKLSIYAGNRAVTVSDVRALSHHHETLFLMLDHWIQGRLSSSDIEALQITLLAQHPVAIFALTQSYVNNMFRPLWYTQKYRMSPDEIAKKTGQKPFSVKKNLEQLRGVSLTRLLRLKRLLVDYDWKMKTGQLNGQLALELLLAA